jgi:hypothetical protein
MLFCTATIGTTIYDFQDVLVTLIGQPLWYAGFSSSSNWLQANPQFPGALPIKDMVGGAIVADRNGALWCCGIPTGGWTPLPQLPSSFKQFMGSGSDGNFDNPGAYITALDTADNAWIIGNPGAGGVWDPIPSLNSSGTMFRTSGTNNVSVMVTLAGEVLWYAGFGSGANWLQANPRFPGALPIKDMVACPSSVCVADRNGVLWHCGLPGAWTQDIPQLPSSFSQFMGSGYNAYIDNPGYTGFFIAALDTSGNAWLIGNPTEGGVWDPIPSLNLPRGYSRRLPMIPRTALAQISAAPTKTRAKQLTSKGRRLKRRR